jgi:subtilisin family serine protease
MKSLGAAAAMLLLISVACQPIAAPGPQPSPSASPTDSPGPAPAPVTSGFDCDHPPAVSGLVRVKDPIADRYIVVLGPAPAAGGQPGAPAGAGATSRAMSRAEVSSLARSMAAAYGGRDVEILSAALAGFSCAADASGAARMAADPRILFVQQDGRKRVSRTAAAVPEVAGATPAAASVGSWGLDRIDQRDLPLDGVYDPGATGAGVHAYVIDTGLDTGHAEFAGRVGEGFSATGDGLRDDVGHGTHVAGTIGGTTFGVAKRVVLHPVRVLVNGSGSDSNVIAGVDWVTDHVKKHGWPAVANMSLGGGVSPALDLAVCNSIRAGVAYAVAAGNDDADACDESPSRIVQAIAAGATDKTDRRASFSNVGPCVDLFAPGLDIVSAKNGGGSTTLSGTSMASPHAAGVAALCRERLPGATPEAIRRCVVDHGTHDKLGDVGAGSPNLLLYARDK